MVKARSPGLPVTARGKKMSVGSFGHKARSSQFVSQLAYVLSSAHQGFESMLRG